MKVIDANVVKLVMFSMVTATNVFHQVQEVQEPVFTSMANKLIHMAHNLQLISIVPDRNNVFQFKLSYVFSNEISSLSISLFEERCTTISCLEPC